MSDSLKSLISDQDGDVPDSAVNAPEGIAPPASLSSVIKDDPSTVAPAVTEAAAAAPIPPPSDEPAAFNFRGNLESRLGISTDSYDDDAAAFEDFASALGQASEVLNSEDFHSYQENQEAFQEYMATQAAPEPASAVTTPEPATPASPFATASISEDAQLLAQQNLITRGEDGTWTPKQPAFQSFADEYNKHDVAVRTNVMKFSQDPTGFVNKLIEQRRQEPVAESDTVKALQEELSAIKQQLADQAAKKSSDSIQKWRETTPLKNANGTLTPYAKEYMRWESRVRQENPALDSVTIHERVLSNLDFAGVTPESSTAPNPQRQLNHGNQWPARRRNELQRTRMGMVTIGYRSSRQRPLHQVQAWSQVKQVYRPSMVLLPN